MAFAYPPSDATIAARQEAGAARQEAGAAGQEAELEKRGQERSALLSKLFGGEHPALRPGAGLPLSMPGDLRLDEAVALALKNSFEVAAAREKTRAADWETLGSYGQFLPRIEYSRQSGIERSRPTSYKDAAGDTVPDNRHRRRDRIYTVRQPIVDLSLIADIIGRHHAQSAAESAELGTREKVAMDAISSFFRLLQARLSLQFAEGYKAQLDSLASRMNARVQGGGSSQVELDRINARSVSAKSAIIEAGSEYQAAAIEFHRLVGGLPSSLAIPHSLLPTVPQSVDEILTVALRANPDYAAARAQADAALAEAGKAYGRLMPRISAELTDSRTYNAGGAALGDPAAGTVYPYTNERRAMAVFTWTLNGGVDVAQGFADRARAREADYNATDMRTKLEESVRTGFDALNAANGRVIALTEAVATNDKVVRTFEEQYGNANRQLLDLLDAYERLYQVQQELVRLIVAEAKAGYLIRRQMGQLVPAILSSDVIEQTLDHEPDRKAGER